MGVDDPRLFVEFAEPGVVELAGWISPFTKVYSGQSVPLPSEAGRGWKHLSM